MSAAHEWAIDHGACSDAVKWLRQHPGWTLTDAWRECARGDWMLWALEKAGHPVPRDVVDAIVDRAVEAHSLRCGIPEVEAWARRWLGGEDRSAAAAAAAWRAAAYVDAAWRAGRAAAYVDAAKQAAWRAAWAAARAADALAAERQRQADEIRAALPEWPG